MESIRIARLPELSTRLGAKRSAIYARVQSGTLTEPVHIGPRISGWPSHEIDAIILAHVAGKPESEIRDLVEKLHRQRLEAA